MKNINRNNYNWRIPKMNPVSLHELMLQHISDVLSCEDALFQDELFNRYHQFGDAEHLNTASNIERYISKYYRTFSEHSTSRNSS